MSHGKDSAPRVLPPAAPLSSRQRDQQRAAILAQLDAVTLQVKTLTGQVNTLTGLSQVQGRNQEALLATFSGFCGRSLWGRLRWLVTGR